MEQVAQQQQQVVKPPQTLLGKYRKQERLGKGTYGAVYKAIDLQTNRDVALKKTLLHSEDEGIPSTAIREISVLKELPHPNVVKLLEVFHHAKKLWLVFEFLDWDLSDYISMEPESEIEEVLIKSYLLQMLRGIEFCHANRIIHRDLKPQNLLIDKCGGLKVADFGMARAFGVPIRALTHEVVTLWYRAPEILLGGKRYSTPVDVWSIGCMFAEMFLRHPLFPGDSEIDEIFHIFQILGTPNEYTWPGISQYPDFQIDFPNWPAQSWTGIIPRLGKQGRDLLSRMLTYDPKQRITARQALSHPYFNGVRECVVQNK